MIPPGQLYPDRHRPPKGTKWTVASSSLPQLSFLQMCTYKLSLDVLWVCSIKTKKWNLKQECLRSRGMCESAPIGFGSVIFPLKGFIELNWSIELPSSGKGGYLKLFLRVCAWSCEPLHTDIYISFIVWRAKQRPTCVQFWETYLGLSRTFGACLTCTSPSAVQLLSLTLGGRSTLCVTPRRPSPALLVLPAHLTTCSRHPPLRPTLSFFRCAFVTLVIFSPICPALCWRI